ncbi:MAG: hypothetical protein ACP5NF_11535 [Thermoanaerobaculum sp.]
MGERLHPFLIPGSWLLSGNYFPAEASPQRVAGSTEVTPHDQFPETLCVRGEVRGMDDPLARPVATEFTLDLVAPGRIRFHMNSIPLGTVLVGGGVWSSVLLTIHYASPDKRILGAETYAAESQDVVWTSGLLAADGALVTLWHARLERVG